MNEITVSPVGYVRSSRGEPIDDHWGEVTAEIELGGGFPEDALAGLDAFSHAEILFHFHLAPPEKVERGSRHPRGNPEWPRVGIFAQRGKDRPNRLGSTIVRVSRVEGRRLVVVGLDAIDGTPVLDIKPVMREFLPRTAVHQPVWAAELMRDYW